MSKADECAEMLAEVRGLFAIAGPSDHIATSLARSRALLDELDEALLALSYDRDRAVFAQMAVLRELLANLDKHHARQVPRAARR